MSYYNQEKECINKEELKKLQEEKFLKQFKRVYENVAYYKKKVDEAGINVQDIRSLEDIPKLPFLSKDDLREAYPDKLLACDRDDVVRIHSTSGTTGKRVIAYYTKNDVDMWEECCARALCAANVTKHDVCQIAYGFGLFTGGLGLFGASQKIGCLTLPMSSGNSDRQLQFMVDLKTSVLCCTPSYAAYLAEEMEETVRERKEKLLRYILNNKEGITNLYKHQKELHGCSAEGHISHLYSARLSSRPLGWKVINVNNVSKLRLIKADNKEIKEIVHNKRKVIEFKEIEKIRHDAREKIKSSINFKVGKIPAMEFGTAEQRKFLKQLLEYKEVC